METGKEVSPQPGHRRWVLALAWTDGGRWLATAGQDHSLRLWNPESCRAGNER